MKKIKDQNCKILIDIQKFDSKRLPNNFNRDGELWRKIKINFQILINVLLSVCPIWTKRSYAYKSILNLTFLISTLKTF